MSVKHIFGGAASILRHHGLRAFWEMIVRYVRGRRRDLAMLNSPQPVPPLVIEDVLGPETGPRSSTALKSGTKILYLIHQFFPEHSLGTEKFVLNLATCMQKRGHSVRVMSYSAQEDSTYKTHSSGFLLKEYSYNNLSVLAYKQQKEPVYAQWDIENPALVEFAEGVLRRERPDLLHIAHGMRVGSIAIAAQRLGIPYVITLTDFFFLCPNCKLVTSGGSLCAGPEQGEKCKTSCPEFNSDVVHRRWILAENILRGAKRVVAPSRYLANLFKREYPWLNPVILPYGIDFSRIKRNTNSYDGSRKLVVLYAGQLDVHKGVHVLIDALRQIGSPNILLKIYGSGPPLVEWKLRRMAKGDARIQFCGVYSPDQLGEVFGSVDCVVIPSLWHENNTIVMREALASHLPCIVSDSGGMKGMILEGKNGFVFRMGDSQQLKDILERLVKSPELIAAMKEELSAYNVSTIEQEASAYETEYANAIS